MEALGQPNVSLSIVAIALAVALVTVLLIGAIVLTHFMRKNRRVELQFTTMRSNVWRLIHGNNGETAQQIRAVLMSPTHVTLNAMPGRLAIGATATNSTASDDPQGSWTAGLAVVQPGDDPFLQPGPASKVGADEEPKPDWPPAALREPVMRQPQPNQVHPPVVTQDETPAQPPVARMAQPPTPPTMGEPVVATVAVPVARVVSLSDEPLLQPASNAPPQQEPASPVAPASNPLTDTTQRLDLGALQERWRQQFSADHERWEADRNKVMAKLDAPIEVDTQEPSSEPEPPSASAPQAEPDPVATQPTPPDEPEKPDTSFVDAPPVLPPHRAHDAYATPDEQWRGTGTTQDAGLPRAHLPRGHGVAFPPDLPAVKPDVPEAKPKADNTSTTIIRRVDVEDPPVSVQPGHH